MIAVRMMSGERSRRLRSSGYRIWQVAARLMVALSKCARSSSRGSSSLVFAFRGSVSLPRHLWSIYDICAACDSPDSASMCPCGLVGSPGVTDISRSRFHSSTTTRWVDISGERPGITGRRFGWPRCVVCHVVAPFVLTFLGFR